MNALVRKEIRLLLPGWAVAMGIAAASALLGLALGKPQFVTLLLAVALIACVAALGSFGREFSQGTFGAMLALPASRSRLWWTKTLVLAGALASLYAAWWGAFYVSAVRWPTLWDAAGDMGCTPLTTALLLAAGYSGALWTTLLFRQVAAALWFTLLAPAALLLSTDALLALVTPDPAIRRAAAILLTSGYSVVGYALAWWLFRTAEDAHWTGGTISLPGWRRFAAGTATESAGAAADSGATPAVEPDASRRRHRPWRALLGKELHLHLPLLYIAGALLASHVGVLTVRYLGGSWQKQPFIELVLNGFWGLWLLMPLIAGATAFAEERKLGLLESQRCQPAGWRRQWLMKFGVVLTLGATLGSLPPWLLEPPLNLPNLFTNPEHPWLRLGSLLMLVPSSVGIALAAFHASTLARNPLQAIGLGIAWVVAGMGLISATANPGNIGFAAWWSGGLGVGTTIPVVGLTLLLLALRNSRSAAPGGSDWGCNAAALSLAIGLSVALPAAIYHRAWEWVQDREPAVGPARWPDAAEVRFRNQGTPGIIAPDGVATVLPIHHRLLRRVGQNSALTRTEIGTQVLEGRWRDLVPSYWETIGVRTDGSLWASAQPRRSWWRNDTPPEPPAPMVPVENDRDWTALVPDPSSPRSVLLLKGNGTLWRWSAPRERGREQRSILETRPHQLGSDTDWAGLRHTGGRVYFRKADGSLWVLNSILRDRWKDRLTLEPGFELMPCVDMAGSNWQSLSGAGLFDLGVLDDGSLWLYGVSPIRSGHGLQPLELGRDWKAVAADHQSAIGLKQDGTIWKLTFDPGSARPSVAPLSRKPGWRAVGTLVGSSYAVAADGSVWSWDNHTQHFDFIELAPSRIPTRIGIAGSAP